MKSGTSVLDFITLNRQLQRPRLTNHDRFRLVLLARFTKFWQQALHIVQPDTLVLATFRVRPHFSRVNPTYLAPDWFIIGHHLKIL